MVILAIPILTGGCDAGSGTSSSSSSSSATTDSGPFLYVSSGACYSGNNTTFTTATSSNMVYRISLSSGRREIIADYFAAPSIAGDSPTGIANIDSDYMYIAVDSATAGNRRIEKVSKQERGTRQSFYNASAFTGALKWLSLNSALGLLVTRTTGIEYIDSAGVRIGAPYANPSAVPCASSNTIITKALSLSNGKIVFIHSTANQNRIGILPAAGGTTCQTVQSAPVLASSFPTAMFYDSANSKLIVAYAGNAVTTDFNSIYAYSVNEATPSISSPQKIYDAGSYPGTFGHLLYGISDMYYDAARGHVYIASATTTATTVVNYVIEKFAYDPTKIGTDNNNVLTRVGSTPFYNYGNDTKCVNQMFVAD